MTSSARARIDCGTVRPSALAVLRLKVLTAIIYPSIMPVIGWNLDLDRDPKKNGPGISSSAAGSAKSNQEDRAIARQAQGGR